MKSKVLALLMIFCAVLILKHNAEETTSQAQTSMVDANGYVTLTTAGVGADGKVIVDMSREEYEVKFGKKKPTPAQIIEKWEKRGEELNKKIGDRADKLIKKVDEKAIIKKGKLEDRREDALKKGKDDKVLKIDEKMKRVDEKAAERREKIKNIEIEKKRKLDERMNKIEERKADQEVKFEVGSEVRFSGVVLENKILEATDALNYLVIKTDSGKTVNVAYSGGLLGCVNSKVATASLVIKAKQRVIVYAKVTSENNLSTCGSLSYFVNLSPESSRIINLPAFFKRFFGWFGRGN